VSILRSLPAWVLVGLVLSFVAAPFAVAQEDDETGKPGETDKPAPEDPAETEALFKKISKLEEEGTKWFNIAGNTDLDHDERNVARKKAYDNLKEAFNLLDAYFEKYPERIDEHEDRMIRIHMMTYWIRKESPLGLLEPDNDDEEDESTEGPKPQGNPPPGDSSGQDRPKDPPPGADRPGPKPPTAPATARGRLDLITEWERRHRADIAGCLARYERFVDKNPEAPAGVFQEALERIAALKSMLKAAYRDLRDDDPDSLEGADDKRAVRLVLVYSAELTRGPPEQRIRAARTLGYLGSGRAARSLARVLKKVKEGPLFTAVADALTRIGGRRVCERVADLGSDEDLGPTVVGILSTILRRGDVEGRFAGEALAAVLEHMPPDLQQVTLERLFEAGPAGAMGLARAITIVGSRETARYIEHIGAIGYPGTAGHLASFLVVNPRGSRKKTAAAARKALQAIGVGGVPYLIPRLDDEKVAVWTAEMLRRITGAKPKNDKRRTWDRWWKANRRRLLKR
jgi:hypothetical protein